MTFNDLPAMSSLAAQEVAAVLHTPSEPERRRSLLAVAEDAPALLEADHDNHPRTAEATLESPQAVASFVVDDTGDSRFAGLCTVAGHAFRTAADLDADPVRQALMIRLRGRSFAQTGESGRAVFDLRPMPALAGLRGRPVVRRPRGRAHMRLAEGRDLPVVKVTRTARFAPPAPERDAFIVTGNELRGLPRECQARLREWRGICRIIDAADGALDAGSAYGETNLLGRWHSHVAGDTWVTADLSRRDPARFRFSILELVAPTAAADLVIGREAIWKDRLATRIWGLNRN